jgi:hypothetical protein
MMLRRRAAGVVALEEEEEVVRWRVAEEKVGAMGVACVG